MASRELVNRYQIRRILVGKTRRRSTCPALTEPTLPITIIAVSTDYYFKAILRGPLILIMAQDWTNIYSECAKLREPEK